MKDVVLPPGTSPDLSGGVREPAKLRALADAVFAETSRSEHFVVVGAHGEEDVWGATDAPFKLAAAVEEFLDEEAGWKAAAKDLIDGLADERDTTLLLSALLRLTREYLADALDAYEHSDGRELLTAIDQALQAKDPNP